MRVKLVLMESLMGLAECSGKALVCMKDYLNKEQDKALADGYSGMAVISLDTFIKTIL